MTTTPNASKKVPQPVAGVYSGGNIAAFSVEFDGIVEFCGGIKVVVSLIVVFDGAGVGISVVFVDCEGIGVGAAVVAGELVGKGVEMTTEALVGFSVTFVLIKGASEVLTVEFRVTRFNANEFRATFAVLLSLPAVPLLFCTISV